MHFVFSTVETIFRLRGFLRLVSKMSRCFIQDLRAYRMTTPPLLPRMLVDILLRSALKPTADGGSGLTRMVLEAVCGKMLPTRADLRKFRNKSLFGSETVTHVFCVSRSG